MKKYIYSLFLAFVAVSLTSCLDLKPESELTFNGYWSSEEAVKAAQIGLHSKLRDYDNTLWQMGEVRSDIWGASTLETGFDSELIANNISETQVYFDKWADFYGLMHNLNDFIKNAPSVTFRNPKELNYMMGQAYGIRAFVYYTLLKAYGDVPITTEPMAEVDLMKLKKKRSPKAEVMAQVKSDIAKSLEYFGTDNTLMSGKSVYWSKSATLALKGDAYLWSGKVLGGGQADFTEAKTALSSITGFDLVTYDKLWGVANENNKEFIFSFEYTQLVKANIYSSFTAANQYIKPLFDENNTPLSSVIIYGAPATTISGANRYCPTTKTLTALSDKQDLRYNTFFRMYDAAKVYKASMLYKFMGPVNTGGVRESDNNVPIYRYADVVLLLAEAKNQLGEDPSGEINQVRKRAYGANYVGHEYANSTKEVNAKAILDERLKEFIGEGKRWWDLVRAGDDYVFNEVIALKKADAYKIYYSISASMLANDSELTQTDGYKK